MCMEALAVIAGCRADPAFARNAGEHGAALRLDALVTDEQRTARCDNWYGAHPTHERLDPVQTEALRPLVDVPAPDCAALGAIVGAPVPVGTRRCARVVQQASACGIGVHPHGLLTTQSDFAVPTDVIDFTEAAKRCADHGDYLLDYSDDRVRTIERLSGCKALERWVAKQEPSELEGE